MDTVKNKTSNQQEGVFTFGFVLFLLFLFLGQKFVLTGGRVPSNSMYKTIHVGDFLIRYVLGCGGTTPHTLLSIPFLPPTIGGIRTYRPWIQLPFWRMWPTRKMRSGDIVTFGATKDKNIPPDCAEEFVKRVAGIAGEEVKMVNGVLFVKNAEGNFVKSATQKHIWYTFEVVLPDRLPEAFFANKDYVDRAEIDGKQVPLYPYVDEKGRYHYTFMIKHAYVPTYFNILNERGFTQKQMSGEHKGTYDVVPAGTMPIYKPDGYHAGLFDFKEFTVPTKGMVIDLTDPALHPLYLVTLQYTLKGFEVREEKGRKVCYLRGARYDSHTFKEDFFLPKGDNFNNSVDGRTFGCVPMSRLRSYVYRVFFNYRTFTRWFLRLDE